MSLVVGANSTGDRMKAEATRVTRILAAPTLQPLVNALATDRLRGRYNATSGAAFSVAFVVSPAISAGLIGAGLGGLWIAGIVLLSLVAATVAVRLRGKLSDLQDGLAATAPVPG